MMIGFICCATIIIKKLNRGDRFGELLQPHGFEIQVLPALWSHTAAMRSLQGLESQWVIDLSLYPRTARQEFQVEQVAVRVSGAQKTSYVELWSRAISPRGRTCKIHFERVVSIIAHSSTEISEPLAIDSGEFETPLSSQVAPWAMNRISKTREFRIANTRFIAYEGAVQPQELYELLQLTGMLTQLIPTSSPDEPTNL